MTDRLHVRNLFLRLLAVLLFASFWSLHGQVELLFGEDGLAPACSKAAATAAAPWWRAPTLFRWWCSDQALVTAAIVGQGAAVALFFNVAPRISLFVAWLLYLSFLTVGAPFLNFQWDNLILETTFFAWFVAPPGLLRGRAMPPHPIAVLLLQWLVFRLHFQSGIAKLMSGDPTWRDLTAMVAYYETAPLPTWLGWYAHQLPVWAHKATTLATFGIELLLPFFYWAPGTLRYWAVAITIVFQIAILLTANYTIFNYLSLALCLLLLRDSDFRQAGLLRSPVPLWRTGWLRTLAFSIALVVCVPLTLFPVDRAGRSPLTTETTAWIADMVAPFRTFNVYGLFATMTLVRREAVIEGSNDGAEWLAYEFRYKPGDPHRAPGFVAPHQPRVDFQLWFLLLGERWGAPYFDRLLQLMLERPEAVAELFSSRPFEGRAPRMLRVAIYEYHFSDEQRRAATGEWWTRTRLSESRIFTRE